MTNNIPEDCCAIVVTYNPELTVLLKLLGQLNKETDFIVIDNGSEKIDRLVDSITVYSRCQKLIRQPNNLGLAKALNIGIRWIEQRSYRFALLFDQDSGLCDLFVRSMLAAFDEASAVGKEKVAAVGPRIINPQNMRQTKFKLFNRVFFRSDRFFFTSKNHYRADFLITSGTLLPLQNLDDIGIMKESYFIDNVDLEWCFRAKSKGYALVGTDQAVLYHAVGEKSTNPLVLAGIMAQHNPSRSYYSSRNRVHLYRTAYSPLGWKLRDMFRFLIKTSWLLLSSAERKQYWHHISRGIRDAKTLS